VQGALEAKLTGDLPLLDPARGRMEAVLALRDANVSFGDVRLPIESLRMNASLADGLMNLSSTRLEALRGSAEASGSLRLNDRLDADLALRVNNMILDDTIRDGTRSARDPKYGGRMSAQINGSASLRGVLGHLGAETPARNLAATLESRDGALTTSSAITEPLPARWGDGRIEIDQGRLMFIPLVRILGNSIARGRSLLTGRGAQGRGTDRATVVFDLCGAEARCEEITYVGAIFAARGRGRVGFDQILDLTVNAGPLEKMQSMMGNRVGRVFGRVTDALASYRVRGTIAEPKVQVRLAGDSVRRAGSAVKSGVGRAVDAVGNFTNAKGDADE
jgi:hypothetical protein